jgi:hypothetical protein
MFMKLHPSLLFLLFVPLFTSAQDTRKGAYGNLAIGYGIYLLDLYDYAGGSNVYNDQTFSGLILSAGIEKKSAWRKNKLVFDIGGELTGGFGINSDSKASGNTSSESNGGFALGIKGLFKMGYLFPKNEGAIVPLIGMGPYFNYINTGGSNAVGNYMYGLQTVLGVDFKVKRIVLTPEIHFGLANWGASDEMEQNGQPGMLEVKVKIAKQF